MQGSLAPLCAQVTARSKIRQETAPGFIGLAERQLLVAMLRQAFSDLRSGSQAHAVEALSWINDRCQDTYFTFEGACEVLGLNITKLRRRAQAQFDRRPQ